MSRSWPRVMSPSPARSTLITSAPNHASSWVHVGPDCTCVKSRMRTPSNALLIHTLLFIAEFPRKRHSDAASPSPVEAWRDEHGLSEAAPLQVLECAARHAFFFAAGLRLVMRP